MCEPMSIASAGLAVGGGLLDAKNQNAAWAAAETARRKQNIQAVRQANTQDANLMLKDVSNFEAYRQELENQTMDSIKAQGTVQTAMAESNLAGRSMERAQRDVENVALRTRGMINANYERDYANIYQQRIANRDQLISQIEGSVATPRPDVIGQTINVAQAGMSGYIAGQNLWGALSKAPTSKQVT